ncbi:Rep [uncultured virus]|uniref:Rep n=1 Tax=uncultured virus TaxID=340016 RepID=A0A2K9LSF7_9VIRU|nr:Rep [uncultured virus]
MKTNLAPIGSKRLETEGNTNLSRARANASKFWCFTYNNYDELLLAPLCQSFNNYGKYLFCKEIGTECGTPHLQGFIQLNKKGRPLELFSKITDKIHWEKCKGSYIDNFNYCTKGQSDIFTNMKIKKPIKDPLLGVTLYQWECKVLDFLENCDDDRKIIWIYDEIGNSGKTCFCKHICLKNENALYLQGKCNDIKYAISIFTEKKDLDIAFFDFPRTSEEYISYDAIECVKNGIFFSGKYEGKMHLSNSPIVICFANFKPELEKLSLDRWIIYEINKNKDLELLDTSNVIDLY